MARSIRDRIVHAWNAFTSDERRSSSDYGPGYASRPYQNRASYNTERSLIASVNTRISIDAAAVGIRHVILDDNERYLETRNSGLNNCLSVEANIDQGARAFRQDIVASLCEKGVIAIVPTNTSAAPDRTGSYDIKTLRVGYILEWYPRHVRVELYDDNPKWGRRREITIAKSAVAIVENPLYSVMNEPNSTLQRLIRKLNLLDVVDEASSSGKLDVIIQLPYVIKSEQRKTQAENRRKDLEMQLTGSKYGVAYADGTEKITQLNRPAENNLLAQVEYLTNMLYDQLGITKGVFSGTADEKEMINYYNRTIEPILSAVTEAMKRSFLTPTARTQKQSIEFFREPFKLVPVNELAEIADKMTRNEILSSNEVRALIGFRPVDDPKAEVLRNKNLPEIVDKPAEPVPQDKTPKQEGELQNGTRL